MKNNILPPESYFKILIVSILFLFNTTFSFSQFSQSELKPNLIKLLNDYEKGINQIGIDIKNVDKTKINSSKLLKLFVSPDINVYNDLAPAHNLSEKYKAESYISNLVLWYPSGQKISLNYDNALMSNTMLHGKGVYSVDIIVEKSITGLYLNTTPNNSKEKLLFRIGFTSEDGIPNGYKIAGIRKAGTDDIDDEKKILEIKKATNLKPNQIRDINKTVKTLLNDYANYLSLIGDSIETIEDKLHYKNSFRELFLEDKSLVYNDILPDQKANYVSASDYINMYSEAYAAGGGNAKINVDSANIGSVLKKTENKYYMFVYADKTFTGNYLNRKRVTYKNRQVFQIVFDYSNKVFKNFKIENMNIAGLNKTDSAKQKTFVNINKPDENESKIKIIVGISSQVIKGQIVDPNISNLTIDKNAHSWTINSQITYGFMGLLRFQYKGKYFFETGIGTSSIKTQYNLNSYKSAYDTTFQDNILYNDLNTNSYNKTFTANYDSLVSLKFIDVPLNIGIYFGKSGKIRAYIKPGITFSFVSNATSKVEGKIKYYGYYPIPNWKNKPYYFEDTRLGFYNYETNKESDIKSFVAPTIISISISGGINIPFDNHISLSIDGFYKYGITNLIPNQKQYIDLFGKTEINQSSIPTHVFDYKKVSILNYGISVGLNYNF